MVMAKRKPKPKSSPTPFGRRLSYLRTVAGLSQSALAERVGTNRVSIARFETSPDANPTLEMVHRLCVALGCKVEELAPVPGADDKPESSSGGGVGQRGIDLS